MSAGTERSGMSASDVSTSLGVVLLDCTHYRARAGEFRPSDEHGLGVLPEGFFECPRTWPVPTHFRVAAGATPEATVRGEGAAIAGLVAAIDELAGSCSLVISDCGFFWAARLSSGVKLPGNVLLSGIDLLGLAALMTSGPIGVLTYSAESAESLLHAHPHSERLRLLGMDSMPTWGRFADANFASEMGWLSNAREVRMRVRDELIHSVVSALHTSTFRDVSILVVECTLIPMFRRDLRKVTAKPIFDVVSLAHSML